ncbi:hypothetical protein ES707_20135 [subsurface metagenome]
MLVFMTNDFVFTAVTPQQAQVLEDNNPTLLLWGPGRSGKSHVAVVKGIAIGQKFPNNRIYFIRRKKVDLRATMWLKFTELLPQSLITKKDEHSMIYKIKNGTEFWGLGLDSIEDVNKLASAECGMAIVEEATEVPQNYFDEKIKRSVSLPRVPFHQTILLCNPGAPAHWIYQELILKKPKDLTAIKMPTMLEELGILPHSFYIWLSSLTGLFAKRYRDGQWVGAEGLVYSFNPEKHIINPFLIPEDWKRVVCLDFGFSLLHAFCCQWWAISSEGKWYCYRQIYMTGKTVEEHAPIIRSYMIEDGIAKQEIICDHDADGRATLNRHGVKTRPAIKKRLEGQQVCYNLIANNKVFFFNNSLVEVDIDLRINKLPYQTEQEFTYYVWATKEKEDMVRKLDHGMDCMRYGMRTSIHIIGESIDTLQYIPKVLIHS